MLLAAGCGGGEPGLDDALGERLAARSDAIAAKVERDDPCAALKDAETLQLEAIDAVNAGEIPAALQEELLGAVNSLLAEIQCEPAVAGSNVVSEARELAALIRSS